MTRQIRKTLHIRKADQELVKIIDRGCGFGAFVSYCLNKFELQAMIEHVKQRERKLLQNSITLDK